MFRPQLFYTHADDLGQPGGNLLRHVAVGRRKVQTDESDLKRPIDAFGSRTENYPANSQDRQDSSQQEKKRRCHYVFSTNGSVFVHQHA
jgi:hypothetical protein